MKKKDISIVFCTYNRANIICHTLPRLINQETHSGFSYEIIVVDNASTDHTMAVVEKISNNSDVPIKYVREENQGLAHARNKGFQEAQGDWIVCFDDDQLADSIWLNELYKVAKNTDADCIGGRTLLDLPEEVSHKLGKGCRGLLGESDYGKIQRRLYNKNYPHDGNVMRCKKIFETIGKFDTSMLRGGQDQDFTRRAIKAGFSMWYAPNAIAYHLVPSYRLEKNYFKWLSYRAGQSFAYMDYKYNGRIKMVLSCLMRIGQALLINLPAFLFYSLLQNNGETLWREALLYRCLSYTRMCFFLIIPRLFNQKVFFTKLEFRKERSMFKKQ